MMELGRVLGRGQAHHILHEATANALRNGSTFATEVAAHPDLAELSKDLDLSDLLDPANYRGDVADIISRIVASIELPEKI